MTLTHYINNCLRELQEFQEYWLKNHEENPEAFPLSLQNMEEWDEQLHSIRL